MAMTSAPPADGLQDHWHQLVTSALLGTDRRPPPPAPLGALTELALEHIVADETHALVDRVAALTAMRRGGLRPEPPVPLLSPPPTDPRPRCPPSAAEWYAELMVSWPVLEDEWLLAVHDGGWRLPVEMVVPLVLRHRADAVRRRRVELAAGPLASWLVEQLSAVVPGIAARKRSAADPDAIEAAARSLPELPVPPDLAAVLRQAVLPGDADDGDDAAFVDSLVEPFHLGHVGAAHRGVLANLVCRLPRRHLAPMADALDQVSGGSPSVNLAVAIARVARLRGEMLDVLLPTPTPTLTIAPNTAESP